MISAIGPIAKGGVSYEQMPVGGFVGLPPVCETQEEDDQSEKAVPLLGKSKTPTS